VDKLSKFETRILSL